MKQLQQLALFTLSFFFLQNLMAQSSEEIIAKNIDAIGGRNKITSITSVKMDNTIQVMGNEAPSSSVLLVGKGVRVESEVNGQKMIQVVTDKGGWSISPMNGSNEAKPIPDNVYKTLKDQLDFSPFINYDPENFKIELAGKEKIEGKQSFKMNYTDKDSIMTIYFIDTASYYILKMTKKANMMGQEMEVSITFSDYKKTDYGVTVPFRTDSDFGGQFQLSSELKKIEFNKPVDVSTFELKQSK